MLFWLFSFNSFHIYKQPLWKLSRITGYLAVTVSENKSFWQNICVVVCSELDNRHQCCLRESTLALALASALCPEELLDASLVVLRSQCSAVGSRQGCGNIMTMGGRLCAEEMRLSQHDDCCLLLLALCWVTGCQNISQTITVKTMAASDSNLATTNSSRCCCCT